jgi:hypothetical protein
MSALQSLGGSVHHMEIQGVVMLKLGCRHADEVTNDSLDMSRYANWHYSLPLRSDIH